LGQECLHHGDAHIHSDFGSNYGYHADDPNHQRLGRNSGGNLDSFSFQTFHHPHINRLDCHHEEILPTFKATTAQNPKEGIQASVCEGSSNYQPHQRS